MHAGRARARARGGNNFFSRRRDAQRTRVAILATLEKPVPRVNHRAVLIMGLSILARIGLFKSRIAHTIARDIGAISSLKAVIDSDISTPFLFSLPPARNAAVFADRNAFVAR